MSKYTDSMKKKHATQAYDKLFNTTEQYALHELGAKDLSELMLYFTKKALETTTSTNVKDILFEAQCLSGDFLWDLGLAAVKDNTECNDILSGTDDPVEFMHGVEAQVQVKAHQPENLKASEEYVENYLSQKSAKEVKSMNIITKRLKKQASPSERNYQTFVGALYDIADSVRNKAALLNGKNIEKLANDFHDDLGKNYYDDHNEMILDSIYAQANKLEEIAKQLEVIAENVEETVRVQ